MSSWLIKCAWVGVGWDVYYPTNWHIPQEHAWAGNRINRRRRRSHVYNSLQRRWLEPGTVMAKPVPTHPTHARDSKQNHLEPHACYPARVQHRGQTGHRTNMSNCLLARRSVDARPENLDLMSIQINCEKHVVRRHHSFLNSCNAGSQKAYSIGKCLMHCWIPRPQDPHNISHQNWPKLCGHIVVSTTLYRPTMPHPGIQAAVLGCLCERAHLNFGPALICSPILSKKTFNYQHGRQSKLNTSQQSQNDKMHELEFDFVQSVGQNSRLLSVELQPVAPGPTKTTSRPQVLRSGRPKIHRSLFWHAVCLVKPPLHRIAVSIWM